MPVPRSNIKTISIQNFKFFGKPEDLPLDGNHLLLYGENGSGKSSLNWVSYTLLECANKALCYIWPLPLTPEMRPKQCEFQGADGSLNGNRTRI